MTDADLLYRIASRFVGTSEISGAVSNPLILAMLRLDAQWPEGDEVAWCSAFVNWCAWLLGLPRSKSLAARSWTSVGEGIVLNEARKGDVVVLSRGDNPAQGHVGLFDHATGGLVWLLGGNQGDKVSVEAFPISRVVAVRRITA